MKKTETKIRQCSTVRNMEADNSRQSIAQLHRSAVREAFIEPSSNGKTPDFGSGNRGSNPRGSTKICVRWNCIFSSLFPIWLLLHLIHNDLYISNRLSIFSDMLFWLLQHLSFYGQPHICIFS